MDIATILFSSVHEKIIPLCELGNTNVKLETGQIITDSNQRKEFIQTKQTERR